MSLLIAFILSAYAAWYVFTTAELPVWDPLREELMRRSILFYRFMYCPICSGFWISLALSVVFRALPSEAFPIQDFQPAQVVILQAFIGAGAIYLIETQVRRLEAR